MTSPIERAEASDERLPALEPTASQTQNIVASSLSSTFENLSGALTSLADNFDQQSEGREQLPLFSQTISSHSETLPTVPKNANDYQEPLENQGELTPTKPRSPKH